MEGVIDHLGRPIISVDVRQVESDALRCLLDTGYNGFLLLEDSVARRMRFHRIGITDQIVLGDGSIRTAHIARGIIQWIGISTLINIHVVPDAGRLRYLSPEHAIHGLIGTALLQGLHVLLDFASHRPTIQRPGSDH